MAEGKQTNNSTNYDYKVSYSCGKHSSENMILALSVSNP